MPLKDLVKRLEYQRQYMNIINNREKATARKRKWRERHPEKSKSISNEWKKRNPIRNKEITKTWRENNKERIKNSKKLYCDTHPGWKKEQDRLYRERHKKETYLKHKEWREKNPEKFHEDARRQLSRRKRELGYIPLNNPVKGFEGHHITKDHIIYIPKVIHKLFPHNHKIPSTMITINRKAVLYLMDGIGRS